MKYDFKCPWCGHEFEEEMSIKLYVEKGKVIECPECHKLAIRTYQKLATFTIKDYDGEDE